MVQQQIENTKQRALNSFVKILGGLLFLFLSLYSSNEELAERKEVNIYNRETMNFMK